jgi:phage terminase Nu1 subunit (DNA packaging protein)
MLKLLSTQQFAELIQMSVATVRTWRCRGYGPPWCRPGRGPRSPVKYDYDEVMAWIDSTRARSSADEHARRAAAH